MRVRSLRARLLLTSSLLLVLLIGGTLAWVGYQANRLVEDRAAADLERASRVLRAAEAERYLGLNATAELLAAFPELNALAQTDAATIRDFLLDYQRRTRRADLLILLSPQGRVLARTDALATTPLPEVESRWIAPTLAGEPPRNLLALGHEVYLATMAPAEAGGTVFAFLLVGNRVDDQLAQRFRDITGEETVILGRAHVLGSTLRADILPWRSIREFATNATADPRTTSVEIAGERYLARAAPTSRPEDALFLSLQSRDQALAPYRRIQAGLLVAGLLGVLAGIAASAVLARKVTGPVGRLVDGTRAVAQGRFDYTLEEPDTEELAALARSFNEMTRGLRERAEMQRFVSASTMQMIQRRALNVAAGGERRSLTVLFSDIRGFTRLAESRAPEEVVTLLNESLGTQAEHVLKYGGDIDKFVGDAIVALFDGDDMALRAIRCAVEIQRSIGRTDAQQAPMAVGIGIATGDVILGSIGGAGRFDYTAVGSQVNLAARLCAMAGPGEILLAESTWQPVSDLVAATPLEPLAVRGFSEPVPVYRMVTSTPAK